MHVVHVCIILLWRNIGAKTSDSCDGTPLSTRRHEADPLQGINAFITARICDPSSSNKNKTGTRIRQQDNSRYLSLHNITILSSKELQRAEAWVRTSLFC